jgi:acyl-CoA synthetase (AMP-forming)/AMP-acid ligase II
MWLTQLLERNRRSLGDRVALADARRSLTWSELALRVESLSLRLAARGVRHGDRIAVLSHDRVEVVETYFALGHLGALFVPLDPQMVAGEIAEITDHAKVAGVVGERSCLERCGTGDGRLWRLPFDEPDFAGPAIPPGRSTEPDVRADDPLAILYTSATTGHPKGVVVDHRSVKDITLGWLSVAAPPEGSVLVNCCPLFHGSVVLTLAHLAAGATVVLPGPRPADVVAAARRHQATHLWLTPETLRAVVGRLTSHPGVPLPDSLTEVLYGAAPMPVDLYAAARRVMTCGFRQVYGVTEAGGPFVTLAPDEHPHADRPLPDALPLGRVIPGMSVRVADDSGRLCPTGRIGEIQVRGDGRMRGYWRDPAATAAASVGGWLRTGDLGYLDDRGRLHLVDRLTDLIIRNGRNVYPAEIERILLRHPAVVDAAVVGVADPAEGEVPLAHVVLGSSRGEVTSEQIISHLQQEMAAFKIPHDVRLITALPRNSTGKVQKRLLVA